MRLSALLCTVPSCERGVFRWAPAWFQQRRQGVKALSKEIALSEDSLEWFRVRLKEAVAHQEPQAKQYSHIVQINVLEAISYQSDSAFNFLASLGRNCKTRDGVLQLRSPVPNLSTLLSPICQRRLPRVAGLESPE